MLLEELLRFFHVTCDVLRQRKLRPQLRDLFLANVDVAASTAFFEARREKNLKEKTQIQMISASAKYAEQIGVKAGNPQAERSWIKFAAPNPSTDPPPCGQSTALNQPPVAAKLIEFDVENWPPNHNPG